MKRVHLFSLVLLVAVAGIATPYEPPDVYIARLVDTWTTRPDSHDAVGFALSVAFVHQPSLFLRILNSHRDVFSAWLDAIDQHTLRRDELSEPGRGRRVFEQVHATAAKWSGTKYRDLAVAIQKATEDRHAVSQP